MSDSWFKPRIHGYGASPANWKGWLAIAGFLVLTLVTLWPWFLSPVLAKEEPTAIGIVATVVLFVGLVIGFIWLCKFKTSGAWAWRWGKRQ